MYGLIIGGAGLLVGIGGIACAHDQSTKRESEQAEYRTSLARYARLAVRKDAQLQDADARLRRHCYQIAMLVAHIRMQAEASRRVA